MSNFVIGVGHTASGNIGCGVLQNLMKICVTGDSIIANQYAEKVIML